MSLSRQHPAATLPYRQFWRWGRAIWLLLCLVIVIGTTRQSVLSSASYSVLAECHEPTSSNRLSSAAPVSRLGQRQSCLSPPRLAIEPYVRPELSAAMESLRPVILAAAARHNRPALSGMSNEQFARVIALLLYNEHNGWLEDEVEPLRFVTPLYEEAQVWVNQYGLGSDFSVWPGNLRPSVALEILRGEVPLPNSSDVLRVPLEVAGSRIDPDHYPTRRELYVALSREISQPALAVEYLAANLERGLYRAHYEGVPVSWRTLAAWHNHGVVHPEHIRANGWASDYVNRSSAYLPLARQFIAADAPATQPTARWQVR